MIWLGHTILASYSEDMRVLLLLLSSLLSLSLCRGTTWEHHARVWTNSQCGRKTAKLKAHFTSGRQCRAACLRTKSCNTVEWSRIGRECVFRKCPTPIPAPQGPQSYDRHGFSVYHVVQLGTRTRKRGIKSCFHFHFRYSLGFVISLNVKLRNMIACTGCTWEQAGINYYGQDIPGRTHRTATSVGCAVLCARHRRCRFWSYCGHGKCNMKYWLKTSNKGRRRTSVTASQKFVSGTKACGRFLYNSLGYETVVTKPEETTPKPEPNKTTVKPFWEVDYIEQGLDATLPPTSVKPQGTPAPTPQGTPSNSTCRGTQRLRKNVNSLSIQEQERLVAAMKAIIASGRLTTIGTIGGARPLGGPQPFPSS